jgi:hypothetical protein
MLKVTYEFHYNVITRIGNDFKAFSPWIGILLYKSFTVILYLKNSPFYLSAFRPEAFFSEIHRIMKLTWIFPQLGIYKFIF